MEDVELSDEERSRHPLDALIDAPRDEKDRPENLFVSSKPIAGHLSLMDAISNDSHLLILKALPGHYETFFSKQLRITRLGLQKAVLHYAKSIQRSDPVQSLKCLMWMDYCQLLEDDSRQRLRCRAVFLALTKHLVISLTPRV